MAPNKIINATTEPIVATRTQCFIASLSFPLENTGFNER
jgi:hypothetical protein